MNRNKKNVARKKNAKATNKNTMLAIWLLSK
jgi:hypothetical protein